MFHFDPQQYGPAWAELLATDRCRPLDAGERNKPLCVKLQGVQLAQLFTLRKLVDQQMAQLCLAGAWLLADDLDASHNISQQIETPSGSFWHAIMHRREGDFSNAKYWFRRVGPHPVFEQLHVAAQQLALAADPSPAREKIQAAETWDPDAFVDLCAAGVETRSADNPTAQLCRQVAQAEWELLFDACYEQAVE